MCKKQSWKNIFLDDLTGFHVLAESPNGEKDVRHRQKTSSLKIHGACWKRGRTNPHNSCKFSMQTHLDGQIFRSFRAAQSVSVDVCYTFDLHITNNTTQHQKQPTISKHCEYLSNTVILNSQTHPIKGFQRSEVTIAMTGSSVRIWPNPKWHPVPYRPPKTLWPSANASSYDLSDRSLPWIFPVGQNIHCKSCSLF